MFISLGQISLGFYGNGRPHGFSWTGGGTLSKIIVLNIPEPIHIVKDNHIVLVVRSLGIERHPVTLKTI